MTASPGDQIEQAMLQFAQQRDKLLETRQELGKTTVDETTKDHLLTVTVAVSGEIKKIKFDRTDYVRMAPDELSALLVETINKARQKAAAKAAEAMNPLRDFSTQLRDSLAGSSDLDEMFGALADAAGMAKPAPAAPTYDEED